MKGIAHFATGIALATFFPAVVHEAYDGSLLPVVAGIAALLPDTLDFKFARYWERFDLEIDPGTQADPAAIAQALVAAMRTAFERRSLYSVICHAVRLGLDQWQAYTVRFDAQTNEVVVQLGPIVDASQAPCDENGGTTSVEARYQVGLPFVDPYGATYKVGSFYGPSFTFARRDESLEIRFLDWHHRWSHSLVLAITIGMATGAATALGWGARAGWRVGLLSALGFTAHVIEDQLGHMGSNLGWPFSRRRMPGLRLLHANDPLPNMLVVWTACAVILLNLDRFSGSARIPVAPYVVAGLVMPWAVALLSRWMRAAKLRRNAPAQAAVIGGDEDT